MYNLFRMRRHYIWEAVVWLKANNPFYRNIDISTDNLDFLPVDGVPSELMTIARQVDNLNLVREQNDSHVPDEYKITALDQLDCANRFNSARTHQ